MKDKNNFLDSNTMLAILLSFLFFFGWQLYTDKGKVEEAKKPVAEVAQDNKAAVANSNEDINSKTLDNKVMEQPEQTLSFDLPKVSGVISSRGFGFKKIELKDYKNRKNETVTYISDGLDSIFATLINDKAPTFTMELLEPNRIAGKAQSESFKIEKHIKINSDQYFADIEIVFSPLNGVFTNEVKTSISQIFEKIESSFLSPNYEVNEFYVYNSDGKQRENASGDKAIDEVHKSAKISSLGSHYFTLAMFDESDVLGTARMQYTPQNSIGKMQVQHSTVERKESYTFKYKAYFGPKKFDILSNIDSEMSGIINYGFFGYFGKFLLAILVWIQKLVSNWGFAVIGLTIVVRILLLPIMISSYKSMKKMQKIQPQLKLIRDKYKEDPQKMNLETMQLMKREKANPVGGCLPMLIQIPIFFALYQVIGNSIELYQAPFILWIKDLSSKDPFYVLPLLVGIMFFIQQRISPKPADPAQAKMMMFMPFLFTFFMISVPSGLNLYIFVSTVFGILQQLFFMKDKAARVDVSAV